MAAPNTRIVRPDKPGSNAVIFDDIVAKAKSSFGLVSMTILAWDGSRSALSRIYSTDPEEYPVGGEKFMPLDAPWPQTVIIKREPHLCLDIQDIKSTYNDYETILAMGGGCLYCVPVVSEGKTLGAMNFTGGTGEAVYDQKSLEGMKRLAEECVPLFEEWVRTK